MPFKTWTNVQIRQISKAVLTAFYNIQNGFIQLSAPKLSVYLRIMFVLCAVASPLHTTQRDFDFLDRF
jgi:hypothetical protein